jgi:hypothetical protein
LHEIAACKIWSKSLSIEIMGHALVPNSPAAAAAAIGSNRNLGQCGRAMFLRFAMICAANLSLAAFVLWSSSRRFC